LRKEKKSNRATALDLFFCTEYLIGRFGGRM